MDKLYCVKCHARTSNEGTVKKVTTKNGRRQAVAKCAKCSTKKCQFIKG